MRDTPNSRQTSVMASPSSRRATKRRRSSITELAFHGIHTSRLQKSEKCNPCVRYEMSPMSRAAHIRLDAASRDEAQQKQVPHPACEAAPAGRFAPYPPINAYLPDRKSV